MFGERENHSICKQMLLKCFSMLPAVDHLTPKCQHCCGQLLTSFKGVITFKETCLRHLSIQNCRWHLTAYKCTPSVTHQLALWLLLVMENYFLKPRKFTWLVIISYTQLTVQTAQVINLPTFALGWSKSFPMVSSSLVRHSMLSSSQILSSLKIQSCIIFSVNIFSR